MTLYYPFDETLEGNIEYVDIDLSKLTVPVITFPKGSFFVDNTFIFVESESSASGYTLLRPGLDYLAMSCNENIPYSSDIFINEKLKTAYVRNAILLTRALDVTTIKCRVAYAGGEETTKIPEYINYVNSLFNRAAVNGTMDEFLNPRQGWGNFLSYNREQLTSGQHIFARDTLTANEIEIGGSLGWSNVELAISSLADVVEYGNDPLLMHAFISWVNWNKGLIDEHIRNYELTLNEDLREIHNSRVDEDQYIFTDKPNTPSDQTFIEHKTTTLRGVYLNEVPKTDRVIRRSITKGSVASNNALFATHLLERKSRGFVDNRGQIKVKLDYSKNNPFGEIIAVVDVIRAPVNITGCFLNVVGVGILPQKFTISPVTGSKHTIVVPINQDLNIDVANTDVIAYVTLQELTDASGVDLLKFDFRDKDDYSISIASGDKMLVSNDTTQTNIDAGLLIKNYVNVTVTRKQVLDTTIISPYLQLRVVGTDEVVQNISLNFGTNMTSVDVTINNYFDSSKAHYLVVVKGNVKVSAGIPITFEKYALSPIVPDLIQANSNGKPYSKGGFILVRFPKNIMGAERVEKVLGNLQCKVNNTTAYVVKRDGIKPSPTNINEYIFPISTTEFLNAGDIIRYYHKNYPDLSLNIVITDEGYSGLNKLSLDKLTFKLSPIRALPTSGMYRELIITTTESGVVEMSLNGIKHTFYITPSSPHFIKTGTLLYSNVNSPMSIVVGNDTTSVTPMETNSFYISTRYNELFYISNKSLFFISGEVCRIGYLNTSTETRTMVIEVDGNLVEQITIPQMSYRATYDYYNLANLKGRIVIKLLVNSIVVETHSLGGQEIRDSSSLFIRNVNTGLNSYSGNIENEFNIWAIVGKDINVGDIAVARINGQVVELNDVEIVDGVLSARLIYKPIDAERVVGILFSLDIMNKPSMIFLANLNKVL